jgi:hypothetical protein
MEQFALVVTSLVLCLTASAIVLQLLRWRSTDRANRERMGRSVHDDPKWRRWASGGPSEQDRRR